MDRIAATPDERTVTVTKAAMSKIRMESSNKPVTRKSLDAMREWVNQQIPGSADSVTGKVLGGAAQGDQGMKFADAAALAQQYDDSSGKQDVLAGFLGSIAVGSHRAEAHELALKITDPTRREEILKNIR